MENPFAVPPPLFSRKRRAAALAVDGEDEPAPFIREEVYHAYSIDGHVRESAIYQDELARRTAVRDALSLQPNKRASVTGAPRVPTSMPLRHLTAILLERAEKERSREMAQVVNVARRLSSLPIADHIEYMRLRQKRIHAKVVRLDRSAQCLMRKR
jgi:hypothetical protein